MLKASSMQVQLSPNDYLAAVRLGIKPRPVFMVIGCMVCLLGLLGLVWIAKSIVQGQAGWNEVIGFFVLCFLPVWYWVYIPWRVNRLFRQHRSLHEPYTVELEAEGLRFRTSNGAALLPWSHVHRWRESTSVFSVYQADTLFQILPKRFFARPLTEEALREALLRHVGPANKAVKPAKP
ncbi:YcxB family protein [Hydrogenophaga sp. MI9]|uniref:YcxB family protein n=1 Tax=Hydrogenophaga sp. MI9 TaxID=3453719 RepID=UPI003EEE1C52